MELDELVPAPERRTSRSRLVAAPVDVVWDDLHRVTLSSLPRSTARP